SGPSEEGDLLHRSGYRQALGLQSARRHSTGKTAACGFGITRCFQENLERLLGTALEHVLPNALLALLDRPEPTLADVLRLLSDRDFRRTACERVSNAPVRDFWLREYESYPMVLRAESAAPLQNKIGAFISNPILNRILTQRNSAFDMRRVMDEEKILLVNLAKGKIGEDAAGLLGAMLVAQIGLAGLGRTDQPEHERQDFYVYLDEFQNLTTLSLANMLSELRKYRVNLVLAHQYLAQLDPEVRDAILGNVGTTISFRVDLSDAEILEKGILS